MFRPDQFKVEYQFDIEKKTFTQYTLHSADVPDVLPDLIRLEKNNGYNSITGANTLLRIRTNTNWTKCPIAGLRPTGTPNFYYSDLPLQAGKTLIVVYVSPDGQTVVIRGLNGYYPKSDARHSTITAMINHI